ncbi:DMT family transporter [Bacillus subtilis]|nr:DMT family transporter [Bacillus subtilis]
MGVRGWGLFAVVSVLWGVPYLFNSIALEDLGPLQIAAGRVVVASLILAPVLLVRGRWRVFTTHGPKLLVVAVIEVVIPFSLIAAGQQTVPSGTTGVLIALEPLFIALLAPLVLGSKRLRVTGWGGLLLGLVGVGTLLGIDLHGTGIVLIVAAALSYGIGAMLMDKWFAETASITATSAMVLTATPLLVVIALIAEPLAIPTPPAIAALLILGMACTAGGFAAFFALIKHAGPTKAALITHAAPIVALLAGIIWLDEQLTSLQLLGCALILTGAALVIYTKPPVSTPEPASPQALTDVGNQDS